MNTTFETYTETPEAAKSLIEMSKQLATGEFYMTREAPEPVSVEYADKPTTAWAQAVDAVESEFAPDYDREEYQNPALQMLNLAELSMLAQMLGVPPPWGESVESSPGRHNLLDIGCGTGRIAIFAAANGQTVTAFDQTAGYVEITANKLERVDTTNKPRLVVAPAETMLEQNMAYDNITAMFAVLNHCEDRGSVVQKLPQRLRPGGNIGISMYGSPDAAVFKAVEDGLPYRPGILVKRVSSGLLLGDAASEVLPAVFPYPYEVKGRLEAGGAEVTQMQPFLCVTSLFPREPNTENIQSYLRAVRNIYGQEISSYLEQFAGNADQLLVASLCADYQVDPARINDAAYFGIVARKEKKS